MSTAYDSSHRHTNLSRTSVPRHINGRRRGAVRLGRRGAVIAAAIGLGLSASACASDVQSTAPLGTDGPNDPRACEPVNVDLEPQADQQVIVGANDFNFGQSEYRADAGTVTFDVRNNGDDEHELAFLPGGRRVVGGGVTCRAWCRQVQAQRSRLRASRSCGSCR